MLPDCLKNLKESFKSLPGIGEKTAERLMFSILDFDDEQIELFIDSLKNSKKFIHRCPICNGLTDLDICKICNDDLRNNKQLLVVEDPKNVFLFENVGSYSGKYFVLNGLISPLDGVNPENIGIENLLRLLESSIYEEIILAFKPSIEGETTALYISKVLSDFNVKVSKLASGVPLGADIEYVDNLTLDFAFKNRKEME